jgi:hypothetical protein
MISVMMLRLPVSRTVEAEEQEREHWHWHFEIRCTDFLLLVGRDRGTRLSSVLIHEMTASIITSILWTWPLRNDWEGKIYISYSKFRFRFRFIFMGGNVPSLC